MSSNIGASGVRAVSTIIHSARFAGFFTGRNCKNPAGIDHYTGAGMSSVNLKLCMYLRASLWPGFD